MTPLEHQLAKAKNDAEKVQICLEAVKESGYGLKYVLKEFKTAELCIEAVKQYNRAIRFVPNVMKEEVKKAVGLGGKQNAK